MLSFCQQGNACSNLYTKEAINGYQVMDLVLFLCLPINATVSWKGSGILRHWHAHWFVSMLSTCWFTWCWILPVTVYWQYWARTGHVLCGTLVTCMVSLRTSCLLVVFRISAGKQLIQWHTIIHVITHYRKQRKLETTLISWRCLIVKLMSWNEWTERGRKRIQTLDLLVGRWNRVVVVIIMSSGIDQIMLRHSTDNTRD